MSERDETYADDLLQLQLRTVSAGIDVEKTSAINANALEVMEELIGKLRNPELTNRDMRCPHCERKIQVFDAEKMCKAAMQLMRMVDLNARLTHFTAGRADSRPAHEGLEWLQALTPEQVGVVQGWVRENAAVAG